uniref:Uncharacterized protein n=1 Tax=Rhabditophanes sp. KR3021 TaxID=114890 RepID=A0AC35UH29_9BILA
MIDPIVGRNNKTKVSVKNDVRYVDETKDYGQSMDITNHISKKLYEVSRKEPSIVDEGSLSVGRREAFSGQATTNKSFFGLFQINDGTSLNEHEKLLQRSRAKVEAYMNAIEKEFTLTTAFTEKFAYPSKVLELRKGLIKYICAKQVYCKKSLDEATSSCYFADMSMMFNNGMMTLFYRFPIDNWLSNYRSWKFKSTSSTSYSKLFFTYPMHWLEI